MYEDVLEILEEDNSLHPPSVSLLMFDTLWETDTSTVFWQTHTFMLLHTRQKDRSCS